MLELFFDVFCVDKYEIIKSIENIHANLQCVEYKYFFSKFIQNAENF